MRIEKKKKKEKIFHFLGQDNIFIRSVQIKQIIQFLRHVCTTRLIATYNDLLYIFIEQ